MLESDRCCRRKPLRQTHASCLRERCSSVKSRRNSPFLEPVPLLAASSSSRGGEAWRGERRLRKTPRNESLLPAICRVLKKCHGAPRLQDPPRPLLTTRPCVQPVLLWRREWLQLLPDSTRPAFLWICLKIQLLAARAVGSLWLQI